MDDTSEASHQFEVGGGWRIYIFQPIYTNVRLSCLALFILSHGSEGGKLWACNGMYNINTGPHIIITTTLKL